MRRHRFDPLSFASGLALVTIAVLGLADRLEPGLPKIRWIAAGALVVLGLGLLLGARNDRPE